MAKTLEELAAVAGVSRATVSRVINGGPVAQPTRQRVLAAIERTGYRPNLAARSLATGRTGVVGLSIHEPAPLVFSDPYFSALVEGISATLADSATGLMLWMSHHSKEETLERILSTNFVDGVICTATRLDDPLVDGLLASDLPVVLLGHRRHDSSASYVDIDDVVSAEEVVHHLVQTGRRRIGHITGTRGTVSGEGRLAGYDAALARAGIAERFTVDGDYSEAGGYRGAEQLIDQGVEAIFAGNDATARGVYRAAAERRLRIPDDLAVAGFDDLDFAARLDPPLTTVRQDVRAQGAAAAGALLRLLEQPSDTPRRIILPTELVIRRSTAEGPGKKPGASTRQTAGPHPAPGKSHSPTGREGKGRQ